MCNLTKKRLCGCRSDDDDDNDISHGVHRLNWGPRFVRPQLKAAEMAEIRRRHSGTCSSYSPLSALIRGDRAVAAFHPVDRFADPEGVRSRSIKDRVPVLLADLSHARILGLWRRFGLCCIGVRLASWCHASRFLPSGQAVERTTMLCLQAAHEWRNQTAVRPGPGDE